MNGLSKLNNKITELEKSNFECKQPEEVFHQYGHIVPSSTDMLVLLVKNFNYLAVNKTYMDVFGLTGDELLNKKFQRSILKRKV